MKILPFALLLSFLIPYQNISAQTDSFDIIIEKFIENYVEENDLESFDYLNQFEILEELSRKPYDINDVSLSDLDNIFFLNPIQKQSIIEHRNLYGAYISLEELQTINTISYETAKILRMFFKIDKSATSSYNLWNSLRAAKHTVFTKYKKVLQKREGYVQDEIGEKAYRGDDNFYLLRYRIDGGKHLKAGLIAEKDSGEEFFKGSNKKGFDFYSAHLYLLNPTTFIKSLSLGDYSISMGQGLILHNDFGTGKSAYVMNIKRDGRPIRPYNSVNENSFFRGIASTFDFHKHMEFTAFYSLKKIDGTIINDTIENEDFDSFSSIIRDGYHRTKNEIEKRGSVNQTNYGGTLKYTNNKFNIGVNHLQYNFSKSLSRTDQLYNLYAFEGKNLSNSSVDYSYIKRNLNIFGEVARSNNGGISQIHSLLIALDKKIDAAISYRKYDANYQVIEANAFGEASSPVNEEAIYISFEARPNNNWKLSGYADIWKSPWAKFNIDAPSSGKESLLRLEYYQRRLFSLYVQYRFENKYLNQSAFDNKIDFIAPTYQHRLRIHLSNKINKDLEIRNRVEYVAFKNTTNHSEGYLIYQDIIYKPIGKKYSFTTRYALFDTDDFNSRIYSYENDIQYEFAVPFYYERGKRFYFLAKYKLNRTLAVEGRYSITSYSNLESISSGNEKINGNNKSEVKLQIRWSF